MKHYHFELVLIREGLSMSKIQNALVV